MVKRIAIIGGGLAGTAQFVHLVGELSRQKTNDVEITIFEPNAIGPGMAYASTLPDNFLLNHEANNMGCINLHKLDNPDLVDFYEWTQKNKQTIATQYPRLDTSNPSSFVPRSLYGHYLSARYEAAKNVAAQHGIPVIEKHVLVEDIARGKTGKSGLILSYPEGGETKSESFQNVVFATGNWSRSLNKEFTKTGRAFKPYPPNAYLNNPNLPPSSTLLIRGTGLSSIDTAIGALESGNFSHVTMVSRHGQIPGIRCSPKPYTLKHLTLENLEKLSGGKGKPFKLETVMHLFKQEMESAYGHPIAWDDIFEPKDMQKFLERQLQTLEKQGSQKWFDVMCALDSVRQPILMGMSTDDQVHFGEHYRSLFTLYRAAMPEPNARKIVKFMQEGKLTVTGGALWTGLDEQGKFEVEVAHKPDGKPYITTDGTTSLPNGVTAKRIKADVFIDASGQSKDASAFPLLAKAIESGLAKPDPTGGIQVDFKSHQVIGKNGPQSDLFAMGAMRLGQDVNTPNSIVLAKNSREIAKTITAAVAKGRDNGTSSGLLLSG